MKWNRKKVGPIFPSTSVKVRERKRERGASNKGQSCKVQVRERREGIFVKKHHFSEIIFLHKKKRAHENVFDLPKFDFN